VKKQKCLESRDHNETLDIAGKTILKQDLTDMIYLFTGFIWLQMGSGGGLL
jgi:hypothetical protein